MKSSKNDDLLLWAVLAPSLLFDLSDDGSVDTLAFLDTVLLLKLGQVASLATLLVEMRHHSSLLPRTVDGRSIVS